MFRDSSWLLTRIFFLVTYNSVLVAAPVQAGMLTTQINGVFLFDGTTEEQQHAEVSGDISGVGTNQVTTQVGICDPNFPPPNYTCPGSESQVDPNRPPNKLVFTDFIFDGPIPAQDFSLGEFSFENNDITAAEVFINSLFLELSAIECDDLTGCNESTRRTGQTRLTFVYTNNDPADVQGSSDGVCYESQLGATSPLCAWVPEFEAARFNIVGRFGSLIIEDIIPTSPRGFVTIGFDPNQNVIHGSVPAPAPLSLLLVGALHLVFVRLSRHRL